MQIDKIKILSSVLSNLTSSKTSFDFSSLWLGAKIKACSVFVMKNNYKYFYVNLVFDDIITLLYNIF